MSTGRLLSLRAGPFRVSLPVTSVRQILDTGGATASAPTDPRELGVRPVSLAEVLGAEPDSERPALLLVDSSSGPVLLTACSLEGFLDGEPQPLPRTVITRWPGLIRGTLTDGELSLVLDAQVLMGVVESWLAANPQAAEPQEPAHEPEAA